MNQKTLNTILFVVIAILAGWLIYSHFNKVDPRALNNDLQKTIDSLRTNDAVLLERVRGYEQKIVDIDNRMEKRNEDFLRDNEKHKSNEERIKKLPATPGRSASYADSVLRAEGYRN
jgi:peptidoglycan hydrolase CwlO-like protein